MGRSKKEKGSNGIMGCMSGMLQLFDFRQEAIDPPHISQADTVTPARPPPDDAASTAGTEAPRDSHERLTTAKDCLLENRQSHQLYEDDDIPMGFENFTRSEAAPKTPISPNMESKNPNVVARLMGIEVLPDETETGEGKERIVMDSMSDTTKNHNNKNSNRNVFDSREKKFKELNRELRILERRCENIILCQSRSLPESPRISSARRSDVDRRLSVQIQKENVPPFINNNYADRGRLPASPTSSTSSYSLRNLDIKRKNCSSNAENKTTSPRLTLSSNSPRLLKPLCRDSNSTPSCSPSLRYRTEDCTIIRTKPKPGLENQTNLSSPRGSPKPRVCPQPLVPESSKSSRATKETRLKNTIRGNKPKFEVEFVKKINSDDLLSREPGKVRSPRRIKERYVRVVKVNVEKKKGQKPIFDSLVLMKKEARSVIPTTKNKESPGMVRTRSTSLAPSPAATTSPVLDDGHVIQDDAFSHHVHFHTYHQVAPPSSPPKKTCFNSLSPPLHKEREKEDTIFMYGYIKTILELMGLRSNTIVSFMHLYSPSHPLDPAIYTKLDAYHHHGHHRHDHVSMSNTRSNKRLVFELVDELLRQRLKACIIMHVRPWMMMGQHRCTMKAMTGRQLLRDVWTDVRGIPSMDCKIVQDIDALVASDVNTGRHSSPINDHDADSVADTILFRIGQEIADSLLCEAVVDFLSLKF